MKDRIKSYMDYKGISAGEFASVLDVQRSNISHILNGRNMPGATFIEKLLLKYPDINARWLLTGVGQMIENNQSVATVGSEDAGLKGEPVIREKNVIPIEKPGTEKQLTKIVLLFSDGTFVDYKK